MYSGDDTAPVFSSSCPMILRLQAIHPRAASRPYRAPTHRRFPSAFWQITKPSSTHRSHRRRRPALAFEDDGNSDGFAGPPFRADEDVGRRSLRRTMHSPNSVRRAPSVIFGSRIVSMESKRWPYQVSPVPETNRGTFLRARVGGFPAANQAAKIWSSSTRVNEPFQWRWLDPWTELGKTNPGTRYTNPTGPHGILPITPEATKSGVE